MNEKKVLFVENFKIFEKWASKTYPFKCQKIKEDPRFDIYDFGSEQREIDTTKYDVILFGWHAVSINKYYTTKQEFYSKYIDGLENEEAVQAILDPLFLCENVKRYVMVQDMHQEDYKEGVQGFISFLQKYDITGIVTPYYCTKSINNIRNLMPALKVLCLFHHIDHTIFKQYNLEKKYDILLFGNDNVKYYPFRNRVTKLLERHGERLGIVVHKVQRPRNYFRYNAAVSNASLSKMMNQSWLTLCTSSKLDYLLGKYFESSFSGSVVCGNMASDGIGIWDNGYVHIDEKMKDTQILETIKNALEDKEKLKRMAHEMQLRMNEHFCLKDFASNLYASL